MDDVARVAEGLSDGERIVMRREPERQIRPRDWRVVRPSAGAFEGLVSKALINPHDGNGDPYYLIAEPLGLAVHNYLMGEKG